MNIGDTLTLLKAGYKANEIKEISALSQGNVEMIELAKSTQSLEDFKTLLEISGEEQQTQNAPEPPAEPPKSEESPQEPIEDKEKADLRKQLDDMRAQLAQAQKANVSADASGNIGDKTEERLSDLMRSLY